MRLIFTRPGLKLVEVLSVAFDVSRLGICQTDASLCGLCEAPGTVAMYFDFDWSRAHLSSMSCPLIADDWGDGS